jgi:hypothetical protein
MPRTRIPEHLVHRPEAVKRNAERFDHLCRLAEEIAFPVVEAALFRETNAAGAEELMDETKRALEALAEETAILRDLDEKPVLEAWQKALGEQLPEPDEEECRQHSRDLSQVLISAWLETLRDAQSDTQILTLSDYLLPGPVSWLARRIVRTKPTLSATLTDAAAAFAVDDKDIENIMSKLRLTLFAEPRLVDLPFDLVIAGASGKAIVATTRDLYDHMLDTIQRYLETLETHERKAVEERARKFMLVESEQEIPHCVSETGQIALDSVSETLPAEQYGYVAKVASHKAMKMVKMETRVRQAFTTE